MRKLFVIVLFAITAISFESCTKAKISSDQETSFQTEQSMQEANRQVGYPAITNFQEKKLMKMIYELRDREDLVCYAYLFNEINGEVGQFLGKCIGYGIPSSTQYSNPDKFGTVDGGLYGAQNPYTMPQPEPNGLFMPEGLSATWLLLLDPQTNEPRPVYVEPSIIVSPFPLK